MSKQAIEIILARQLASYLATPCMVFNSQGNLVFYNEPAETILGQRFEETGEMLVHELARIFTATDGRGVPLPADALPLRIALLTRRPAYRRFWIRGLDGVRHHIAASAFPLIGDGEQFLGVMSISMEVREKESVAARAEGRAPCPPSSDPGASEAGGPDVRRSLAARPQKEIEIILTRQLASCLATPIIILDSRGTVLYYNEPGAAIAGRRFEEIGELPASVWSTLISAADRSGMSLPRERRPLVVALTERRPVHSRLRIRGLDRVRRQIEGVAFPIIGQAERFLGVMGLFWEVEE